MIGVVGGARTHDTGVGVLYAVTTLHLVLPN